MLSNLLLLIVAGCNANVGGCIYLLLLPWSLRYDPCKLPGVEMVSWERWPTDTGLTSDVANTPDNDGGVVYWCYYCLHYTVHYTCPHVVSLLLFTLPACTSLQWGSEGRGGLLGIIMTGNMQPTVYFRYKFTGEQILSKYLIASAAGNWILFRVGDLDSIFLCEYSYGAWVLKEAFWWIKY